MLAEWLLANIYKMLSMYYELYMDEETEEKEG